MTQAIKKQQLRSYWRNLHSSKQTDEAANKKIPTDIQTDRYTYQRDRQTDNVEVKKE